MTGTHDTNSLDGPLLFARVLDGEGGGRVIGWDTVRTWKPENQSEVLWAHLCRSQPGVQAWLEEHLEIPEPTAELLVSDDTRPRAFRDGRTLVATLRGINFNPGAEPEDMISMQMWCDGRRLITLRRHPLQTPRDVLAELDRNEGPLDAGATITRLAELLVARMNLSMVDMNHVFDALEDEDPGPEALRRKVAASVYRDDRTMQAALQHFADFWGGAAGLRIRKR